MVDTPIQLKNLSHKELKQLASEIRSEISFIMSNAHKPYKASLSVVELTVAIHHVFHAPMDKILLDDGEQTYAHKILTGRRALMHTLKQRKGLSGLTSRAESDYDAFGAGHGCNSISSGLGIAVARDIQGKKNRVVAIISNLTTMAGQVYEAMSNAGYLDSNMIVILNDSMHSLHPKLDDGSKMVINPLSSSLSKLQSSRSFRRFREAAKKQILECPSESQNTTIIVDDAISIVFGKEARGRVRGLGFGVTPSKVGASVQQNGTVQQLQTIVQNVQQQMQEMRQQNQLEM